MDIGIIFYGIEYIDAILLVWQVATIRSYHDIGGSEMTAREL